MMMIIIFIGVSWSRGVSVLLICPISFVQVTAGGTCAVDIPFKTGYGGMKNKDEAKTKAMMSEVPNCGNITVNCDLDMWTIGGIDALLIGIYVLMAILAVFLIFMLGSIAITHDPPKEEGDMEAAEPATGSTPLLPP